MSTSVGCNEASVLEIETDIPSPKRLQNLDRTWKTLRGISFASPNSEIKTSDPFQHLQLASSEERVTLAPEKESAPLLVSRSSNGPLDFAPSQEVVYPDLSLPGPLFGPPAEICGVCPLQDSSLAISGNGGSDSENLISEGNSSASAPLLDDGPFRTPLGFHIPAVKLQSALDAESGKPESYWQYTLYRGPEGEKDIVKVHYCKNKENTESIAQLFLDEEIVGFDIEWKSNATSNDGIKKNVSLIQLASERRIALFHIARYPNAIEIEDFVAPSLKKIMESPNITKVGVAIKGDCTRLHNHLKIDCRGRFELSHLYKLVKYSSGNVKQINKMTVALATQVQEHFRLPLWKGDARCSDWSLDLNYEQIRYAASDSYAGFQLFHMLEAKRRAMDPTPPRPAHADLNLPIRLASGRTVPTNDIIDDPSEDSGSESGLSIEEIACTGETNDINDESSEGFPPESDSSIEEKVSDFGNTVIEETPSLSPPPPTSPPSSVNKASEKPKEKPPQPIEVVIANAWVEQYNSPRGAHSPTVKAYARPAELRAYALWNEQALEVPAIASLLRDPPLQNSTVANYICRAIHFERLPYMWERIKDLERYHGAYGVPGVDWKKLKQGGQRVGKEVEKGKEKDGIESQGNDSEDV